MDRATDIRGKVLTAIGTLKHKTVTIPIFDEVVNPAIAIPAVDGASGVYVLIQDQQEQYSAIQTVCNPRFDLNMTIRVVTKWGAVGKKKVCEDIADAILSKLRDARGASLIAGIQHVEMITARSIAEYTNSNLAFSKVIILNFKKNG